MLGNDTNDELLRRILAGDQERFAEIVDAYQAKIRIILAAMLPDKSSVEDIAQEVFVTIYTKLSEFRIGSDFDAWISTIARNYALNERKKILRRWASQEKYRAEIEETIAPPIDSMTENVGERVIAEINDCMKKLDGDARGLIRKFHFEAKSGRAIAKETGQSENWVRVMLHRARLALTRCLRLKGALQDA